MQSNPDNHIIHPALTSFADECCATLARLIVYVGVLALFAIAGVHFFDQLQLDMIAEPASQPGFALAERSRPAFAVSSLDPPEKSESYEIFRHPEGGRKDVFHWGPPGEKPVAELEIYRPGGEFVLSAPRKADLAARLAPGNRGDLEAFGVIGSKFGNVALFRRTGHFDAANSDPAKSDPTKSDQAKSCLGFIGQLADPALLISGWSCQGTTLAARRAAIGCMLDRLTLLASGNDPRLAELFAHAELRRSGCGAATAIQTDWVMGAENPRLRGAL